VPNVNAEGGPVFRHPRSGVFATTQWSVVLAAGNHDLPEAAQALERLCQTYWYPLYAYVRRQGRSPEDAQDSTQEFFFRLLDKGYLAKADPQRGKFRTFLLGSMKNFLINEWKQASRLKRGGHESFVFLDVDKAEERFAAEPIGEATPDSTYDRRWAVVLIEQVFATLRREYASADKARLFEALKAFIWGDTSSASYLEIGQQLKLTEGTVKVAVHRLRQRFRELLRAEVAHTVARPEDIDGELRHLIAVMS